jgi:peroxiredoxin
VNFLRSVFVSAFTAYLAVASAYALVQLARGMEPLLAWLGMTLAALGPLAFFTWVMLAKPARTVRHPVEYSVISALGLAIAMAVSWRHGAAAGMIHVWAGLAVVGWIVYLRWYSPFGNRSAASLTPGGQLPDFNLQNTAGETVNSSLFRGRSHVLLFYRGNWCPFCTAQIRELAQQYRDLESAGAVVVLISPQPLSEHRKLAARFDLPMQFLRDPDNQAAKLLGIVAPWGTPMGIQLLGYESDTVLPTVVISDGHGIIVYSDQTDNYRIRPKPAEFLQVLTGQRNKEESPAGGSG